MRHFIGFNRLWISFLSTSGLFWLHYSWRNMFNSELGTANISSVPCDAQCFYPWLQKFIPKLRAASSTWMSTRQSPFWGCSSLYEIKVQFLHSVQMFFSFLPYDGLCSQSSAAAAHTSATKGSLGPWTAKSATEFNRSKQGSCSAPSYFHSGTVFLSTFHYLSPSFYLKIKRNSL